jgi:hypothetical protein
MEADMGFREVANWCRDLPRKLICNWVCDCSVKPDFKQIVEKSLALFGVFTGVTLSFYIKDFLFGDNIPIGFVDFSWYGRALISASVISLLLRYIVGSAVHLNATYIAKVTTKIGNDNVLAEEKKLKSESLRWLSFDILVLVVFGLLAVYIIYSPDLDQLLLRSAAFIGVGLVWSLIAIRCRPEDRPVAARWAWIDGFQALVTLVMYGLPCSDFTKTCLLAAVYIVCLFLDFCVVSRPPKAPAVAVP